MNAQYETPIWTRLRYHANPWRMAFSSGVWGAAWYLFSYMIVGTVLFSVILTATVTSGALVIVWAGFPLLIGTAYFIRGCVAMERGRARVVVPEGLPALEPMPDTEGFFGMLKGSWSQRVTHRGLVHFVLLYVPLMVFNTVVVAIWLTLLGTIAIPIWYRFIPDHQAIGNLVTNDWRSAVAAVVSLVLFLAWNYVLVAAARVNVTAASTLVVPHDPLAQARHVLQNPGPLGALPGH